MKNINDKLIKVGIVGAAGYTASELLRILKSHPDVELTSLVSKSQTGKYVNDVHQDLFELGNRKFDDKLEVNKIDVVFLCGGHGASKAFLESKENASLFENNVRIVDLSQDYRISGDHPFVYGLTEFFSESIKESKYVANPGCFATCIQLALAPLAKHQKLNADIHITAITGSTGAGQSPSKTTHFSWRQNNISAYKAFAHQHEREINQTLKLLQPNWTGQLCWVPLRGDFARGIFATIQIRLDESIETIRQIYNTEYEQQPFAHLIREGSNLHLKQVVNTNHFAVQLEKHDGYLHITACIDNLLKGASGSAVQNMNLMLGLPANTGLNISGTGF